MGSQSRTCKTRFLIISDTHNQMLFPSTDKKHAFRDPLPECDVLLHCGDLTMTGELEEYESQIRLMSSIKAELKLVIAGNHDLSLDKEWWDNNATDWKRRKSTGIDEYEAARELWTGKRAKAAGITYLDEGLHDFVLSSGAKLAVYASPYQPDFYNWAFKYNANEDRFNFPNTTPPAPKNTINIAENPVPNWPRVDIMMTHGPPLHVLDTTIHGNFDVGCPHLLRAATRARPRIHAFGHIHEGWGAQVGNWKQQSSTSSKSDPERPFEGSEMVIVDSKKMMQERAVHIDLTEGWDKQVFGKSTLFVNAAIMTASSPYRPDNAPFLVDIELPVANFSTNTLNLRTFGITPTPLSVTMTGGTNTERRDRRKDSAAKYLWNA